MTAPVTPATEKALREAMARLIEGRPRVTDGKMTKENLYREAGVSRATMNRATAVMDEWNTYTAQQGRRTVGEARRDSEISQLQDDLCKKTQKITELQRKLDAAATVIGALHHENKALREHIASRGGSVISIDQHRA
ncbi:hypothetical protein ACIQOW_36660 [Kitasatospora sp. NPDC091335]|uniref:hypothetical protein n=1 Tax=Kitasatospora sp. NPDC091335 TaxID=3364085 RepID=UPI0037F3C7EC